MKKKITIIDKSFTPVVVLADTSSALYEDRCGRLGERNLLSDTEIVCKAMDGTKEIASVKAHVLQVETLCEREKTDSVAMVLPITTHLYIESLVVDAPHRKLGIATAMLDFLISMAAPETVSMFAGHEQAEVMAMLKKLKFIEAPIVAMDVPWKKKNFFYKRLKRLAR